MSRKIIVAAFVCVAVGGCARMQLEGEKSEFKAAIVSANAECQRELSATDLNSLGSKVELTRISGDEAPPFEMLSNNSFPSDSDLPVIAKWATIRDRCVQRTEHAMTVPAHLSPRGAQSFREQISILTDSMASVGSLVVALHNQKLTYGEFAQRRYEISHGALVAVREIDRADVERDAQIEIQAREQFAASMVGWNAFIQSVNSRRPLTVVISGAKQR